VTNGAEAYLLGEHHVFRFNNPEEVRKQRDRATMKSHLQLSVSAADLEAGDRSPQTRPDSPAASTDQADVDWTYAKREAALARLGLDPTLDNLPDEELNKLFEKITKVKTLRDHNSKSRPESSLSHVEDIWSDSGRPFSSDATDDTSVDAGHASPFADGNLKDVQNQLESRLLAITESSEAEDLKVEKDHMEHQLRLVRTQMKRLLDARARGETDVDIEPYEPVIYTARQLRLIRKVLDRWRAHRSFSMAEVVLSTAVLVKEANVVR
jgi:kinesin family protein 1